MSDAFFGELYLRSTLPFLSDEVTTREVECLRSLFAEDPPFIPSVAKRSRGTSDEASGPIIDVGCGHGRHAAALSSALRRPVIGVERDAASLAMRRGAFPAVRGDFRALPLRSASAGGAYAWYSTLFVYADTAVHRALLLEIARVLKPGSRLVIHTAPFERLEAAPRAELRTTLPDGSHLQERSEFDPKTGLDRGHRTLRLPDGRVLSGTYTLQYYRLAQLEHLLSDAGFGLLSTWGGLYGEPLTPSSIDLIVGAVRNDA